MTKRLENKYQQFWFEGFNYQWQAEKETLRLELNYSLDRQVNFREVLEMPVKAETWEAVDLEELERALSALHIIGGISYYKAYLPAKMAGLKLTKAQADFWHKVYQRGLGEFFYQNQIDFRGLINFPFKKNLKEKAFKSRELSERSLVPIGGGKDSVVTAEMLKMAGEDFQLFSLRDAEPIRATAEIVGRPRLIVQRQLDNQLFQMNAHGAYNGHVPITAYISFLLAVCAVVYDYRYIVMSLEKSANYGQLLFHGMDINHQYSKSEEFEKDFREYLRENVSDQIEYFSLLRGFNELRIAKIFAGLKNFDSYAPVFTSCNANFKIEKEKSSTLWCGHCPKCAFVFLILAPFVPKEKMLEIFGKNLTNQPELFELYEEILGMRNFKPFECVGTVEESQVALWMISQNKAYQNDWLVKHFRDNLISRIKIKDWPAQQDKVLKTLSIKMIPEKFKKIIASE